MLSRTSRVHTACLLCRSPYILLHGASSFPLLCGPQWLLSVYSNFVTRKHSSGFWVDRKWGTHGRKGWEIKAKAHYSSQGTRPESRHKAQRRTQRILITSCPSAELKSEDLYKHVLPTASAWTRDHQQKWSQTEAKWPDKTGPLLRVLGRGHNSQPLLPSQGKRLGEPTLALWGHPTYTPAGGDLTSQREALISWGGGLCDSGQGRDFRLLLSTLRAPGRRRPVLPTRSTRGGAHRGQRHWELSGCSN